MLNLVHPAEGWLLGLVDRRGAARLTGKVHRMRLRIRFELIRWAFSICYTCSVLEIGIETTLVEEIKKGNKCIEGRLGKPKFLKLKVGDTLSVHENLWYEGEIIASIIMNLPSLTPALNYSALCYSVLPTGDLCRRMYMCSASVWCT